MAIKIQSSEPVLLCVSVSSPLLTALSVRCSISVKFHGKASHASAYPWEGVNALDAAVLAYNNLSVLRQQLKPDWRLHGERRLSFQNKVHFIFFPLIYNGRLLETVFATEATVSYRLLD